MSIFHSISQMKKLELLFYSVFLFVAACFVYHRGQDVSNDLLNYHFYMGYFLTDGRFAEDMAAAGWLHSFFNPIADAVTYLSLTHLPFPLSAWILLLIQLMSIPAIVLLAKEIARELGYQRAFIPAIPAVVLSLLSPLWWSELGTAFIESWTAPLIIYGVYFLFSAHKESVLSMTRIAIAGALFGLSVGLKMTNGLFVVSGFLMLGVLLCRSGFRVSILAGFYFLAGCVVGFLPTAWWNWYLWSEWGSPFFPFYNAIFKSEFYAFVNWSDKRHHFSSFQEFLIFIVQAAWGTTRMTTPHFADARFLFVTMLVPAAVLCKPAIRLNRQLMAFILFMASSILLWVFMFSIPRYLILVELLLGLLLWILVVRIVERDWLRKSLMIGLILCAGLLIKVPTWGYAQMVMGEKNPFSIEMDEQLYATPARYIVLGDRMSYILPSFHPDSKFYGFRIDVPAFNVASRVFGKLAEPSELPLRILAKNDDADQMPKVLQLAGYDADNSLLDCKHFRTRFGSYIVCELQSRSEKELVEADLSDLSDASHCDGVIDSVNGASPASQSSVRTNLLVAVKGWLAASVKVADVPDRVYLVLSNAEGKRYLFDAVRTQRIDVGSHFKNPALNYSGYVAAANVSKLFGQYHLGLAYGKDNKILVCPQFSIPIEINQD